MSGNTRCHFNLRHIVYHKKSYDCTKEEANRDNHVQHWQQSFRHSSATILGGYKGRVMYYIIPYTVSNESCIRYRNARLYIHLYASG